jgi:hypothetical protein
MTKSPTHKRLFRSRVRARTFGWRSEPIFEEGATSLLTNTEDEDEAQVSTDSTEPRAGGIDPSARKGDGA